MYLVSLMINKYKDGQVVGVKRLWSFELHAPGLFIFPYLFMIIPIPISSLLEGKSWNWIEKRTKRDRIWWWGSGSGSKILGRSVVVVWPGLCSDCFVSSSSSHLIHLFRFVTEYHVFYSTLHNTIDNGLKRNSVQFQVM